MSTAAAPRLTGDCRAVGPMQDRRARVLHGDLVRRCCTGLGLLGCWEGRSALLGRAPPEELICLPPCREEEQTRCGNHREHHSRSRARRKLVEISTEEVECPEEPSPEDDAHRDSLEPLFAHRRSRRQEPVLAHRFAHTHDVLPKAFAKARRGKAARAACTRDRRMLRRALASAAERRENKRGAEKSDAKHR